MSERGRGEGQPICALGAGEVLDAVALEDSVPPHSVVVVVGDRSLGIDALVVVLLVQQCRRAAHGVAPHCWILEHATGEEEAFELVQEMIRDSCVRRIGQVLGMGADGLLQPGEHVRCVVMDDMRGQAEVLRPDPVGHVPPRPR